LQTCPVNVHYLLHVADSIQYIGPVWCYWAFPMERYCSFVGASVKSRRFPYTNLARRIRDVAQLRVICDLYGLHGSLKFNKTSPAEGEEDIGSADVLPDYPRARLLTPRGKLLQVTPQLRTKIAAYLATAFGVRAQDAKPLIPNTLNQWGRLLISGGGDLVHARGSHTLRSDGRDASFVRYELLVDLDAHRRNAPERLKAVSHYGQLEHLFALPLAPKSLLNKRNSRQTLLLALIREAPFVAESSYQYPVVWYEGELGSGEVVDAQTIQCVVGRVLDKKRHWIIDRS
ncbi:hypothetical protein BDV93DRAFT_399753, partial [Ceratobasidium sp. AG-I]